MLRIEGLMYKNLRSNNRSFSGDCRNLIMLKAVYRFSLGKKNTIRVNQCITNADEDSGLREDAKAK